MAQQEPQPPAGNANATPILRKEYLDMIPEFSGETTMLTRFISICDKLVTKFYVAGNPNDFQNEYLFSTILTKIRRSALDLVTSTNTYSWPDVRRVLLNGYLDKRDCYTLNLEMCDMRQGNGESPFSFYQRVQKLLNLQLAYFVNHSIEGSQVLVDYARKLGLRVLLRGLHEPVGSLMRTKNPSTLEEALNMLTNDFQFKIRDPQLKNQHKTQQPQHNLHKQQHPHQMKPNQFNNFNQNKGPQRPMPDKQFQKPFNQPFKQHNQPQHPQKQQQQQNHAPRPPMNQNPGPSQPYQPTPMSISTRNSGNPWLNQITGYDDVTETDYETDEVGQSFDDVQPNEFQFNSGFSMESDVEAEQNNFLESMSLETDFR